MERTKRTIRAIVLAIFLTAIATAMYVMAEGTVSTVQQWMFALFVTVAAGMILKNFIAGIAAAFTAVVMFALVTPHLPNVINSWPH